MTEDQLRALFGETLAVTVGLWVIAAGVALALIIKLWPALTRFVATMNALAVLPEKLSKIDTMEQQIASIHHETHHNNGSSIKDASVRTEAKVDELRRELGVVADEQQRQGKDLTEHLEWSNTWSPDQEARDNALTKRLDNLEDTLNPRKEQE